MTPNRRLDQLEPLVADGLQKIDRLVEGQGQLLEVATRADQKADIAAKKADTTAKGVANLTIKVNNLTGTVNGLVGTVDNLTGTVNSLTSTISDLTNKVDDQAISIDQIANQQAEFQKEVKREFQQVNQKFDVIIDLLRQR